MSMKHLLFIALIVLVSSYPQNPIIGIYTQDSDYAGYENFTYIASSYIKSIEMCGAQVIPIYYHYNTTQLTQILSQINGVVFPGG
jgi:gamma-glutamyl hydrolase